MKFSLFFIDRPVFAWVISIIIMIVGVISFITLPVSQYPEIAPPTIQISAMYPGASPDVLADTVATPIEQEINGVENMLYMTSSSSSTGRVQITITFAQGTDPDEAQVLVQNRISRAEPKLPEVVRRAGVVTAKASPDILLAVHLLGDTDKYGTLFLSNYAYLGLRDELLRLDGVGDVVVWGAAQYSMRVWLDPQKMASRNITARDVIASLQEQNVQVAAGTIGQQPNTSETPFQMTVQAQGRLKTSEEFSQIIVKTGSEGQVVYLGDIARIELGSENYDQASELDGRISAGLGIFQQPGSNALATAELVKKKTAELAENFPPGMNYTIAYNPTIFVEQSINSVYHTLLEAIILVVLVVLLFLQSWRAAVIPLMAIPVSLIGAIVFMQAFGFSLNNLSLFGLVLAIGLVVDDAIVVVEAVERNMEEGLERRAATRAAMKEVGTALISIALVLSSVFIPTAFITGISGEFYRQFALTIASATIISAFVSLTLSPAMCAVLLRGPHEPKDKFQKFIDFFVGWFFRGFNRAFDALAHGYSRVVKRIIRAVALILTLYLGLLGLGGYMFHLTPVGFIPEMDQGMMLVSSQLPDSSSLTRTRDEILRIGKATRDVDGVAHTMEIIGFSGASRSVSPDAGALFVPLEPFESRQKRGRSAAVIAGDIQKAIASPDARNFVIMPPPVPGIGTGGGFKFMLQARTGNVDYQELDRVTKEFIGQLNADPRVASAFTTYRAAVPQFFAEIDRTKAKMLDVPMDNIFLALQTFFGASYVNDFNLFSRTYRVMAQAESEFRDDDIDLRMLQTRNTKGELVPLASVAKMKRISGPDRIVRHNLYVAAEIQGQAPPGVSSGQAIQAVQELAENLPQGYEIEWVDIAYQQLAAGSTAGIVFLLAVVFVFLLLAAQYESWGLPLSVILIVPMCLICALAGILIRGFDNNILSQIGFVVLIGLAAKNAILIVEFAVQKEEEGMDRFTAAVEACRLRLRPIIMTSAAFLFGVVPLLIATGPGAEMRQDLGTTVFAGTLGVTFFGLFLTPVFFVFIRAFGGKARVVHEDEDDEGENREHTPALPVGS